MPTRYFEFDQALSYPIRDDLPREIILGGELYRALGERQTVEIVYGDPSDAIFSEGKEGGVIHFTNRGPRVGTSTHLLLLISCAAANDGVMAAADAARAARFEHGEEVR